MSDYNINIIGYGYVGGAIGHLFKPWTQIISTLFY